MISLLRRRVRGPSEAAFVGDRHIVVVDDVARRWRHWWIVEVGSLQHWILRQQYSACHSPGMKQLEGLDTRYNPYQSKRASIICFHHSIYFVSKGMSLNFLLLNITDNECRVIEWAGHDCTTLWFCVNHFFVEVIQLLSYLKRARNVIATKVIRPLVCNCNNCFP